MSCLYRALSYFHPKYATHQMRALLCQYLAKDPDLGSGRASQVVPWETGRSLQQYVQRMQHASSWGGAIEIKAYCDLFGMNVKVYSMPNRNSIEFLTNKNTNDAGWIAIYWTGGHYEPIRSTQEHDRMEQSVRPRTRTDRPNQGNAHRQLNRRQQRPHANRHRAPSRRPPSNRRF